MEHPLTDNWFVLRDLTRPNAKRPAYRLLEEKGIEVGFHSYALAVGREEG